MDSYFQTFSSSSFATQSSSSVLKYKIISLNANHNFGVLIYWKGFQYAIRAIQFQFLPDEYLIADFGRQPAGAQGRGGDDFSSIIGGAGVTISVA